MTFVPSPFCAALAASGLALANHGALRRPDPGYRMTGLAVIALAIAPVPAQADQFIEAADNATIDCELSRGELTRIALIDDGFANVSKIASGYPYNDFEVTHEPVRGDIYISVPPQYASDRVSFFATSTAGYVYRFACRLGSAEASQLFITNPALAKSDAAEWEAGTSPDETAVRLIEAMASDAVLPGFAARAELSRPRRTGTIEVQQVAEYLGDATRSLRISDPEFAANFDEHVRQCVFYDLLLGRYSMRELSQSGDIWATIAPGSAARAQKFLTRQADDSVTASIVTCRQAYTALNDQWAGLIDEMTQVAGRQLYPRQTAALAQAKLIADLPVAYQYLTDVSQSASDIFRQVLTINAMNQAMHGFAGASGTSSMDVFAQTRADIQTERTYSSIANNAMKWVPILNVVLTVVFYALFPVLFPLFLMPKTGPIALKGYVTGFFYLAAWGPLFVILHMILMFKGASDVAAAGGGTGLSLATFAGMSDVNSDIGILAGYLVASVPFLAGGVAKGAMAISGQATSYLNPSQNAAEEAAREASTGNVSLGNSNIENSSVFSRQFAQGNLAPSVTYGAGQARSFTDSGTQTNSFPAAEFAHVPNSSYPFTPTLGRDFNSRLSTIAGQSRSQSETFSNLAQQSTSSALTRFHELREAWSASRANDSVSGTSENDSIGTAFNEIDSASRTLQQQFGLSRRAADDITVSWFLNGDASVGARADGRIFRGRADLRGGRNQSWTDSDIGIASEDRSRLVGALAQISDSNNWSSTREGFLRETSSSSEALVSSSAAGMTTSLTEAQSYSIEARRSEELASRLEEQASWYESASAAGSLNLSQAYREWGMAEIDANRDYYGPVHFDDLAFQMSAQGRQLQARFVEDYSGRIHQEIEDDLALPSGSPVSRPGIHSRSDVRSSVRFGGVPGDLAAPSSDRSEISAEVDRVQQQGDQRLGVVRGHLNERTRNARGASAEAADEVKEW